MLYAVFVSEKSMYLQPAEVLSLRKRLGQQSANPQITNPDITKKIESSNPKSAKATFSEGLEIYNKFADL